MCLDKTNGDRQPQPSSMIKTPNSLRAGQIITGVITIELATFAMIFPGLALYLIAIWLSVSLLFGGIEGVIVGASVTYLSKGWGAISIVAGAIAVLTSVAVLAYPGIGVLTSTLILSIGLFFLGSGSIARGVSEKSMTGWARTMYIAVGAITVGLSIPIVVFQVLGIRVLLTFAAVAPVIIGASHIIAGIRGAVFRPIHSSLDSARRKFESEAA
jgi:uncharacterized membrane protein HdeD (DUF308 family)